MGNICFILKDIQPKFYCKECKDFKYNSLSHCTFCNICTSKLMYHCKECNKCVHFTQSHCYKCNICTNKNSYHCNICNLCINQNSVHCKDCHQTFTPQEYNYHSKTICKEDFTIIPVAIHLLNEEDNISTDRFNNFNIKVKNM